jgi:hypothetical protein
MAPLSARSAWNASCAVAFLPRNRPAAPSVREAVQTEPMYAALAARGIKAAAVAALEAMTPLTPAGDDEDVQGRTGGGRRRPQHAQAPRGCYGLERTGARCTWCRVVSEREASQIVQAGESQLLDAWE